MSLKIESMDVDLAGNHVLRDVNATMQPGEIIAIVGRNGAGKTTLLRSVMGLIRPRSGRLSLDGIDLTNRAPHERSAFGFGYAPEDRVVFPTMSVAENITLSCEVLRLSRHEICRRVEEVVTVVPQLKSMLPRSGAALSGGQGKMVALARALMVGTRFVLLDEPFQGLAPVLARQYGDSLRLLRATRPQLCIVVTESNASLLNGVHTMTYQIDRGSVSETSDAGGDATRNRRSLSA